VTVPLDVVEVARAWMLGLFREGFEEVDHDGAVELAAYTDEAGEREMRSRFGAVDVSHVADDWPERWRRFHRPVTIGPLWIGPPWEEAPKDALAVVIDPGRAFGTGAHPTTRLCAEFLLELPLGSVLDVGCGSGVLSIAAARLGHGPVIALDNDPAALEVTAANAETNGVELDLRLADALADELPAADAALANGSYAAAIELAPRLESRRFVASGYFAIALPELTGFRHRERRVREGWAADLFERTE